MKHIPGAEGMRGIACLIVVILHNTGPFIPAIAQYTKGTEKYGVWIFFVLSAFLLTCKILDNERSLPALGSYYISRTFRIIPPFIVAAYTYYIFGYFDFNKFLEIISFNDTFMHLWTIPVEFKFYFALPFLTWIYFGLYKRYGIKMVMLATIAYAAAIQFFYPYSDTIENSIATTQYSSIFVYGITAAIIYLEIKSKPSLWLQNLLGAAILLFLISLAPGLSTTVYKLDTPINLMNKYSILGIPFAILILLACSARNFVGKICNLSAFRFVGKFSFSIYLYHWLFLSLDTKVFGGNYLTFLSSITFSLILGIAAYYLIERPCNALRHYLEVNIRTRLSRSH